MTPRTPTPVDAIADKHFDEVVALSPLMMTSLGLDERQDELDDFSPRGSDAHCRAARTALRALSETTPMDDTDTVTVAAMRERLGLRLETHDAAADLMDVSNIASGLHSIREIFDLMPTATDQNWATLARRLHAVPTAVDGWLESQSAGIEAGHRPAIRQVNALADQCEGWIAPRGFFDRLLERADASCEDLSTTTRESLAQGVAVATTAYAHAITRLRDAIAPLAVDQDAVGVSRYRLASRHFLGMTVDLEETYRWGLDQVAQLNARQEELCSRLRPGMTVAETKKALDQDPAYLLHGSDAMRTWMQTKADEAVAHLHGAHFDIPLPAQRIECMIAPTHDGGIYYTEPSEDFVRPGRMWWSVPEEQTTFSTWRELTTVYHEGVPGHHLQISAAISNRESLNTWRRSGIWVSGHGEGWALYAEQLMADLGYLDDPAMMLGMLDGQAMRAVRVVIDIGMHCGFAAPTEVGGGEWTFEKALAYFNANVAMDPAVARFEVMRYFGWPGQAPAYKIGQRVWTDIRDARRRRDGSAFDLKAFHAQALNLGALGLDTLRSALES
ncbi:MAG: DUF885 domain-containing protein [Propionibacteriaceae bacterium]|nr:DUF885 domain-containing protein [Propionibacteriaceae bacterium]